MAIATTDEHRELAKSVSAFAARHTPTSQTRAHFTDLSAGGRPWFWDELCEQGLHLLHLPEGVGGFGAGLMELAVVTEALAMALCPGPFMPTVLASAAVAGGGTAHAGTAALLAEFAGGATGALVRTDGVVARADGEGWLVDGVSTPVLGLPGAERVVVAATVEGRPAERVWFVLAAGAGEVEQLQSVDLTRSLGRLRLRGHRVADEALLAQVPEAWAELVIATVLAAEAAGTCRWGLQAAVEYAKTREQFGRPIGSFQAVQHKAALLAVNTEIATAAAWDAARAEGHDEEQQRLATAQAMYAALSRAVDAGLETITLFGGIGFTWEHDAHLYQRRALSVAAIGGPEETWANRLGELGRARLTRDFDFVGTDDLPKFRALVRAELAEAAALPDDGRQGAGWMRVRGGRRQTKLAQAGLVAPHFPRPYGLAAGPLEQAVIQQEFTAAGLDQPNIIIGGWLAAVLVEAGTDAQRERFMLPTLSGEIFWCQLFSEPGAGSDLAGLRTRAEKVEGGWKLNGQKVWNSMAHQAEWGICLARTDAEAPKHKGISYFLVDMSSPGVTVRPLKQATGNSEFNEVFLDDVFVPDDCLVGEPNDGWRLAITTLANERLSIGVSLPHGPASRVRDLIESDRLVAERADAVRILGRCLSRELALGALNLRAVLARVGGYIGAEVSIQKVFNAIAQRDNSRDLLRLLGPGAAAVDASVTVDDVTDHIALPSILFGGGTVEIQLNVIAQRVLGLPR